MILFFKQLLGLPTHEVVRRRRLAVAELELLNAQDGWDVANHTLAMATARRDRLRAAVESQS